MRFDHKVPIKEIATLINAKLVGNTEAFATGINEIHVVEDGDLVFVDHPKYYEKCIHSAASFIIINKETDFPEGKALLIVDEPFEAYLKIVAHFQPYDPSLKNIADEATIADSAIIYPNVYIGKNVQIGVVNSPNYYSHYSYFEARNSESEISIGNNVSINNHCSIEALSKITIQDNVMIGINCSILDNDGHSLEIDNRLSGTPKSAEIVIEKNVFIGDNVTILKGVTIGEHSVVGNGSVVTKSVPSNVIVAGNPAQIIKEIK